MKKEALKLADILEGAEVPNDTQMFEASAMIRRLVDELDTTKRKYKNMHNLATQAMSRVHELEKEKNR